MATCIPAEDMESERKKSCCCQKGNSLHLHEMSQAEPMEVDQHDQRIRCTIPQRIFAQIDYPGNVRNIDRALETLGGEKEISNVS